MKQLHKSEFWEDTINTAAKRAQPIRVIHHYRPIGLLVTLAVLVLVVLTDHGVPFPMAVILAALVLLLTIVFS